MIPGYQLSFGVSSPFGLNHENAEGGTLLRCSGVQFIYPYQPCLGCQIRVVKKMGISEM
jgi:hypothetical protein